MVCFEFFVKEEIREALNVELRVGGGLKNAGSVRDEVLIPIECVLVDFEEVTVVGL